MKTKRQNKTDRVELAETNNLLLSFNRMHNTPNCCWKRALYHALLMSDACTGWDERTKLREVLRLP